MFVLTSEFILGLLIGILHKIHKNQLHVINQKIDKVINPRKKYKTSKQIGQHDYLVEGL